MNIHFNTLHDILTEKTQSSQATIDLFSPFVSVAAISKTLANRPQKTITTLITTWRMEDLVSGISDLELFRFCQENNIYLFLNNKLHLKSYLIDHKILLTGSANLTQKGLGLTKNYNYETLVEVANPSQDYLIYLTKIRKEAVLVNNEIFEYYQGLYNKIQNKFKPSIDEISDIQNEVDKKLTSEKFFLISALPMSRSIDDIYSVLSGNLTDDYEIMASARHDIANYDLDEQSYDNKEDFKAHLKIKFFEHPFIFSLCEFISEPKRFGAIKEWVQNNCTDVPVPSRRDLTGNVQVLYNWLIDLGNDRFTVSRPNYSEIISPKDKR